MFLFNPGSVFFTAIYTESLFYFVTISALYLFFKKSKNQVSNRLWYLPNLPFTIILLTISVSIRSNGLFYIVVPGYFLLRDFLLFLKEKNLIKAVILMAFGIGSIFFMVIPYWIIVFDFPYRLYCLENHDFHNNQPIWCKSPLPNLYEYNQKTHWNVTFLGQYRLSRIIFIYWGMHTLLIVTWLIYEFLRKRWKSFFTLGFWTNRKNIGFYTEFWDPFMLYTIILYIICTFWAHTQSCTRFFASSPCFFWFLAHKMVKNEKGKSRVKNNILILYIIYFNIAGTFMFSNYLPWT